MNRGDKMANKYKLNVSDEQIDNLKKAFQAGSPLDVALSYAQISKYTFYYWVSIANVVRAVKEADFVKEQEEMNKIGIDLSSIREQIEIDSESIFRTGVNAYFNPDPRAIKKYRENSAFRVFANQVYDIILECDKKRSEVILYHLTAIRESVKKRGAPPTSSQWFLERTLPRQFGRTFLPEENDKRPVEPIKIEFVSADEKDTKDRVKAMERTVEVELGITPNAKS
jgi:hypothetical protein